MRIVHIIAIAELAIILFFFYLIARVLHQEMTVSKQDDFITALYKEKKRELLRSGSILSVDAYLVVLLVSPVVLGFGVYFITANYAFTVLAAALGFLMPRTITKVAASVSEKKFEERYAESLEQMSSSLRAGLSIAGAVDAVASGPLIHPTVRRQYALLSADLLVGIPVGEAFRNFADRTGNRDAEDVALAIDVQNEVGGHEAEVIQSIAHNIRSRIMLRREVSSIFSATSSMIWMMDAIPYLVILGFAVSNTDYVSIYFSNYLYSIVFILCCTLPFIGSYINHKTIAKIRRGA